MKQIIWIIGFLVLVFLGDRLGGYLLQQLTLSSQFRYSRLYTGQAEADLLFVGNSRGLTFYQPYLEEKTGLTTFNLSYNGLPVDLADALVRDYYDQYASPKQVIIEISICDRFDKQLLMNFSPYLPFSGRIDSLISIADPKIRNGIAVSHLFRYNSEIFQRAMYYLNRSDKYWVINRQLGKSQSQNIDSDYEFIIQFPEESPEILGRLVRYCQSRGSQVSLVVGPYFPPFGQRISNLNTFIQAIEQATGLAVLNYTGTIPDYHHFADYQHLNLAGSKLFVDQLLRDSVLVAK